MGEAPGELEDAYGSPFVGPSGKMLGHILSKVGLSSGRQVFLGNLCQVRPPNNDFTALDDDSLQAGLAQLSNDILRFDPQIVVLLGNYPLRAAGQTINISAFRGTVFKCVTEPFMGSEMHSHIPPSFAAPWILF